MEWNHCSYLGFTTDTILACFDPEVILLLQSKFQTNQRFGKMSKIHFQDGGCLGFSIGSFSYFVSARHPNVHHKVLIQLDNRDVQNMNSQHFSYINV